jgi:hypothetical protein
MYVVLLAIMIFISATLAGLFAPPFKKVSSSSIPKDTYTCCDTGDKENCRAQPELGTILFNKDPNKPQDEYALLKSNIHLLIYNEEKVDLGVEHLNPLEPDRRLGPRDERVFENPFDHRKRMPHYPECLDDKASYDGIFGRPDKRNADGKKPGCYKVPDDLLIYLCRSDSPGSCDSRILDKAQVRFDVYIRLKDIQPGGELSKIPDVISDCYKPQLEATTSENIAFRVSPGGQQNLQLRTFKFLQEPQSIPWLSPYCKPAIYLYPERKTEINVSVFPQGKMLLTIPPYPKTGWDVVAEPNGDIYHLNKRFDYLYYEASIPDQLIEKPKEGYVISYEEREVFLRDLVQKLGLNEKETSQFVEYWTPILPKAPYYFVGVIPTANLHEISPLLISPRPDHLIRISLYFEALEHKKTVTPPTILPVSRNGYTAVEWGGIMKQDKDHPFSCFM